VVLVTGGSRGIGYAIARQFALDGALVILCASSGDNLERAADAIAAGSASRPETITCDLRYSSSCQAVFERVSARYGRCDVLINAAGATRAGDFLRQADEDWSDGFALKFFACVRLCRLFWPMLSSAQGHVVNISGGAARTPDPGFLIGGSVNAAMMNFSKGLAAMGKRDGVNVNTVLPGTTETLRIKQLFEQRAEAEGTTPDEIRERTLKQEGISSIGHPEDVADLVFFLCSRAAGHIQGTAIAVDGGATAGVY
jgi:NAD(P)-dependent dehydrogenase (short-subunit alcohol dehydrogenase family)